MSTKLLALVLISLILACGFDSKTNAQSSEPLAEASRLNTEVIKLFREQKYDEALPLAKQVLKIRETHLDSDDERVIAAVINLGAIYEVKNKWEEAGQLFERALTAFEKKFGSGDARVAAVLDRLIPIYFNRWKFSESRIAAERALAINEKVFGAESVEVANSVHRLAEFYRYRNPEKAEPFYDRALIVMRKKLASDNPMVKKLVENYRCFYYETDQMEKLKEMGQRYWPEDLKRMSESASSVLNGRAIKLPKPTFPRELRSTNVSGRVVVKVWIDERGKVIEAKDMCGTHPALAKASLAAAHKAEFTPTKLSGQPVKVQGIITYNFVIR